MTPNTSGGTVRPGLPCFAWRMPVSLRTTLFNPESHMLRAGWRIPWLLAWVMPLFAGVGVVSAKVLPQVPKPWLLPAKALLAVIFVLGALGIFRLFARHVEHRQPTEIQVDRNTPWHLGLGFLFGGGAMLVITAILALAGCYRVEALNSPWLLLRAFVAYVPQSFSEDFLFCLILYRLIREGLGRRAALIIAPLLFGAVHMGNAHESLLGITEIFTGGMVMYYLFERTGRFWSVWALHFSWNFTMNGVLGMANSGQAIPGFIKPALSGPVWLTGGATGPEASILAVGLDLLLLLLLWRMPEGLLRVSPQDPETAPQLAGQ